MPAFLHIAAVLIGFCLDLIFGDPKLLCHPVILMGRLISRLDRFLHSRLPDTKRAMRTGGLLLAGITVSVFTAATAALMLLLYKTSTPAWFCAEVYFSFRLPACRSLFAESRSVYDAAAENNLSAARSRVGRIVGRDTGVLDLQGVEKACVETIAESTSDGITAPLFFLVFFGVPGGFFYKSINTMDSMIGYRNETYRYFGTAAARLDDIVNFIPARITGLLMAAASLPAGLNARNAFRILIRDHAKRASPNSAWTESAMAGALGVQLAGDAVYFGKPVRKPKIGDPVRGIEARDIIKAERLMLVTSVFAVLLYALVYILIWIHLA